MLKHARHLVAFGVLQAFLYWFANTVVWLLRELGFSIESVLNRAPEGIDRSGRIVLAAFYEPHFFFYYSLLLHLGMTGGFVAGLYYRKHAWMVAFVGSVVYATTYLFFLAAGMSFVVRTR